MAMATHATTTTATIVHVLTGPACHMPPERLLDSDAIDALTPSAVTMVAAIRVVP